MQHDWGLTQAFFLCTVNHRGHHRSISMGNAAGLAAAAVLELILEGAVTMTNGRLTVTGPLPVPHLAPVYRYIEARQPLKARRVVEAFAITFTNRGPDALVAAVVAPLEATGAVTRDTSGLHGRRPRYLPNPRARDSVIRQIRTEFLEGGALSDEVVILAALLDRIDGLSQFFPPYERQMLRAQLREIRAHPASETAAGMIRCVEELVIMTLISAT